MRYLPLTVLAAAIVVSVWAGDWPMPGGNAQHNGWAGAEQRLTKANIGTLKLLYKYQTDNQSKGLDALTTPIINGNLITYRGFKEMLMFAGSSNKVFSVDADLNRLLWESDLPYQANTPQRDASTSACPGGLTAPIVMAGSSSSSLHFAALASRVPAATGVTPRRRPSPYLPPLAQSIYPLRPTTLTELNALYAVSSDGYLHVLNSSTGKDLIPSVRFVPPNARVTSLNIRDNVVYATSANSCDGYRNALFAIDLLSPEKTVTSFVAPQGGFAGTAGTTIGNDGTIYLQAAYAPSDRPGRPYESVIALAPKTLAVKNYFTFGDKPLKDDSGIGTGITPEVFSSPGRDLIIAGGRDGRLYLLDSRWLGGADHHTPIFVTARLARNTKNCNGGGFRGSFSSWLDVDTGARMFYAPVFGAVQSSADLKASGQQGGDGSILALKLSGSNEQPTLQPVWVSRGMIAPAPAVIANDMVFVLSTGQATCLAKAKTASASLHVFDAVTGKKLYSSGDTGADISPYAGLSLANGRVYFAARDNAVYCFGVPGQQRQLVEQ